MSTHSPALLAALQGAKERDPSAQLHSADNYLTHLQHGVQMGHVEVAGGTEVAVYRISTPTKVWLSLAHGHFNATSLLTAAEARLISEALLKAAEDAEEAQRAIDQQRDAEIQREQDWQLEDDLAREAEERGEEYVPAAIGVAHMTYIEVAMLYGKPLKEWQQILKPSASYMQFGDGGRFEIDCSPLGMYSTWFRWTDSYPGRYVFHVVHNWTGIDSRCPAVVDDFGALVLVTEDCHS